MSSQKDGSSSLLQSSAATPASALSSSGVIVMSRGELVGSAADMPNGAAGDAQGFFLFAGTTLSLMNASLWSEWALPTRLESLYFGFLGDATLTVADAATAPAPIDDDQTIASAFDNTSQLTDGPGFHRGYWQRAYGEALPTPGSLVA